MSKANGKPASVKIHVRSAAKRRVSLRVTEPDGSGFVVPDVLIRRGAEQAGREQDSLIEEVKRRIEEARTEHRARQSSAFLGNFAERLEAELSEEGE